MSASQISSISTQVFSTRKRKRDSDGESTRRSLVLSFKMETLDVSELFHQLRNAIYGEGDYAEFGKWDDKELWVKFLSHLYKRRAYKDGLKSVISIILYYAENYAKDPDVDWIGDVYLKSNIIAVFGSMPIKDQKGHLSVDMLKGILNECVDICEQVGENNFSSTGRSFSKRYRGASSSSGLERGLRCSEKLSESDGEVREMVKISKELTCFCEAGLLTCRQLTNSINYFHDGDDVMKMMKIQMWSGLSEDNKVKCIKSLFPSNE